jgi:methylmalonyl-CoA mutase N-terminal domain/subunit
MRNRFGARDERSLKLRFHAQTAGCSLTWQQPYNNVVRTAIQALAAVLGGAQSLHTNSLDEAYALPSEHAATLALRTQQVILHETGVAEEPDPFGGSWYLEHLTDELDRGAHKYIEKIDEIGGMISAIERGYPQAEIAGSSYDYQRRVETGDTVVVGVNRFQTRGEGAQPIDTLRIGESATRAQCAKLRRLREERSGEAVRRALDRLRNAAETGDNLMPFILEAVKSYATLGEICESLRQVFGVWQERNLTV